GDDVAHLLQLNACVQELAGTLHVMLVHLLGRDTCKIKLDRRVLAIDAVIERCELRHPFTIGLFVKLHDVLEHDLHGLADTDNSARDIGKGTGGDRERRWVEGAGFAIFERRCCRTRRAYILHYPRDEARNRHSDDDERNVEHDVGMDDLERCGSAQIFKWWLENSEGSQRYHRAN